MSELIFSSGPLSYEDDNTFVAHLPAITGLEELFRELNEKLLFPSYFGFNWSALSDLLRDLSWIKKQRVLLIHDMIPKLSTAELTTYMDILKEAIDSWKEGEAHSFDVVFPGYAKKISTTA
jgi:RNAse (barnase) inhibitor barstar